MSACFCQPLAVMRTSRLSKAMRVIGTALLASLVSFLRGGMNSALPLGCWGMVDGLEEAGIDFKGLRSVFHPFDPELGMGGIEKDVELGGNDHAGHA